MRILHVTPFLWSGAGQAITALCDTQCARHDVRITTSVSSRGERDWPAYRRRLRAARVGHTRIDLFNRDPEVFTDADRVVIDRAENRHAAFGLGIHRCLGSNLARMELIVAIEEFLARFPDFELSAPDDVIIAAGQVRVLAVAAPVRLAALPDVPTFAEAGLNGYEVTNWFGVQAPRGTPAAVVQFLNQHMGQAFTDPKVVKTLADGGILPMRESVEQFQSRIAADYVKWRDIVRVAGIKPE